MSGEGKALRTPLHGRVQVTRTESARRRRRRSQRRKRSHPPSRLCACASLLSGAEIWSSTSRTPSLGVVPSPPFSRPPTGPQEHDHVYLQLELCEGDLLRYT